MPKATHSTFDCAPIRGSWPLALRFARAASTANTLRVARTVGSYEGVWGWPATQGVGLAWNPRRCPVGLAGALKEGLLREKKKDAPRSIPSRRGETGGWGGAPVRPLAAAAHPASQDDPVSHASRTVPQAPYPLVSPSLALSVGRRGGWLRCMDEEDIPPEVPTTQAELDQAIMLLGNLAQSGTLKPSLRTKLKQLVGVFPTQAQAAAWKQALKGLRPDMRELDSAGRQRRIVRSVV